MADIGLFYFNTSLGNSSSYSSLQLRTNYSRIENLTTDSHPHDHNDSLRLGLPYLITCFIIFTALFLVGFFGNALVIYVVFKSNKMRTLTNFYLVSLACADCLVLAGGTLPAIPELFVYKEQWIYGRVMCSVFVFLQYLGINASALSITAFTIERYIGICHPMKAQIICTVGRAKGIIACLWIFSVLYNACWLYLATTVEQTLPNNITIQTCTFRISREQYRAIYMVDLLLFYILPLVLTCVLYTLIGLALRKSTKDMTKPINPKKNRMPTIQQLIIDKSIRKDFQQSFMGDRKDLLKRMEHARLQVVKMLIVVATMFAILWLPYRAWVVYNSFASVENRFYNDWYFLAARAMVFLNNAMNPVLYSAMSKKFRKAFIMLTCIGRIVTADQAMLQRQSTMSASAHHHKALTRSRAVRVVLPPNNSSNSSTDKDTTQPPPANV